MSGFEFNVAANTDKEFAATGGSPLPTISTTTVRSGTYSGRISSLGSGSQQFFRQQYSSGAVNTVFDRFYFNVHTLPSAENCIWASNDASNLSTLLVYVTLDNAGVLRLYDEDGQITGTTTLSVDTWYRIEIKLDRSGSAGSHIVEGKVDGTTFATLSNR